MIRTEGSLGCTQLSSRGGARRGDVEGNPPNVAGRRGAGRGPRLHLYLVQGDPSSIDRQDLDHGETGFADPRAHERRKVLAGGTRERLDQVVGLGILEGELLPRARRVNDIASGVRMGVWNDGICERTCFM